MNMRITPEVPELPERKNKSILKEIDELIYSIHRDFTPEEREDLEEIELQIGMILRPDGGRK